MKRQPGTIIAFLLYSMAGFAFCYWYKEVAKLSESRLWIDLGPILLYMLLSAMLNFLFFFAVKLAGKIPVKQFIYLTTRSIGLGLSLYIIAGLFLPTTMDEYYFLTGTMTAATLFILVKEKVLLGRRNNRMGTS